MRLAKRLSILAVCLIALSGLAGHLTSAAAQAPEKRIALVVGNAAYAKSPLATAANDAGLIAQTLQAAGFDVIGARDLDGDTLRKSFRDFINKAEASGPDTVAMVYLAGYGLQLAGDNYFVPVDSAINRDTDVPIEALRTGDYIRQLASLPLKAGIVVLDAARQQPFVNGQIASGLALVEADPHMLIAFNAAPGTVAPVEQGPYGVYAQSLAEMIRTGGLPLPEVFNRLRLRVNEASKGAQVPWDSQKVDDVAFSFFERAPDAPAAPPSDQAAANRSKPIRELGVQDAYAAALERDTLPAYEDFLGAYPDDPMAKRVRAIAAARREAVTWRRTYRADTPNAYWSYLQRYPRGPHAADARRRLSILTAPLEPPQAFDVLDYDVPPPPPEELIYIDRPVLAFGDPEFDFVAPPPAPVYYLPPPPDDFIILEPPPPPIGLFILPQPIFIPIPIYVRPPRYVAAPPNNIIFANIHNRAVINNVINRPPPATAPVGGPGGRLGDRAGGRAGAPAGVAGPAPGGATPGLPPAVAQRAALIQQGKAPVPPSAAINPAARTGFPGAGQAGRPNAPLPANAPGALPPNQTVPRTNALPVPGARGTPPVPPSAAVAPTVNPNARLAPGGRPPPGAAPDSRPAIGAVAPGAPAGPSPRVGAPPPSAAAPSRPAAAIAPRPQPQPELRRGPPPSAMQGARSPPPAARVAPSAPPPRMAAPPPRMAAPPPRMAAPSPPPRMAAPPPPPRMAAPPPPRMAAPPPRMAAPPPRMAAPPPRAAPAGRPCPPGARC